jgi:hypothetical protein
VLAFGQFVFPFFALLIERIRNDGGWLVSLCVLTLIMRSLEAALLILPAIEHIRPLITSVMLLAGFVLVGTALWLLFTAALAGRIGSIIPAAVARAETASK